MSEVLGDAVLDLTADLTPYERSMDRALMYTRTSLDRMSSEYNRLTPAIQSVSRSIDQSRLSDMQSILGGAADEALRSTANLRGLEAQISRMRPAVVGMGGAFTQSQRQIASALTNVVADHQRATGNILAAAATQRRALDEVTGAVERQVLAVRALSGDTNAMRQLGPATHSNLLSTLTQGQSGGGGYRQLIYGSRGTNQPGSIIDPLVVTLEAGQYANMGDRAAAIGAATATAANAGMGLGNAADTLLRSMSATEQMRNLLSDNNDANSTQTAALLDIVHELQMVRTLTASSVQRQLPPGQTGTGGYREQGPWRQGGAMPYELANAQQRAGTGYVWGGPSANRGFITAPGSPDRSGLPVVWAGSRELERARGTAVVPYRTAGLPAAQTKNDWQTLGQAIADAMWSRMESRGGGALPREPIALPPGTTSRAWSHVGASGPVQEQWSFGTPANENAIRDYIDGVVAGDIAAAVSPGGKGGAGSGTAPTVATLGALRNLFGRGGGGGGGGPIDAAAGGGGGGGGGFPWGNILFGGGGGGGGFRGPFGMRFGIPGARLGSIGSFAGLGAEHVVTTGLGIAGSAATAVAGGALLGSAALTKSLVGGGADVLASATTISNTKQYMTALNQLNTAIATYGKNSQQGVIAQRQFNQAVAALGSGPGVQAEKVLAQNTTALQDYWKQVSQGAQVQASNVFEQVVQLGHDFAPRVAQAAQQNLSIINTGLHPLFAWLEGPTGVGIFNQLEGKFKQDLPTAVHAFDQAIEVFLKLMGDAVGQTGGLVEGLDDFFTRVNHEPPQQLQSWVSRMIGDFRTWERFVKLLGKDVVDLFRLDAGTGKSIIVDLTTLLQKLNAYETSTRGSHQLMTIFTVHKQEVMALLGLIRPLGHDLTSLYMNLAPPLTGAMTELIKLMVSVLSESTKLGPFVTDLTAAALIMAKLGVLAPGIRATAGALGLMTKAEAANAPASAVDAAALGAEDAALTGSRAGGFNLTGGSTTRAAATAEKGLGKGVAGSETAAGGFLGRFSPTSMGKSLASKVFGKAGIGEGEALLGISEKGLATAFGGLLAGGGGLLAGDALQHLIPGLSGKGTRGGTAATLGFGVAGGAAGAFFGPLGVAAGAAIGSAMGPKIVGTFDNVFGIKQGEDYGKRFAKGFTSQFSQQYTPRQAFDTQRALQAAADKYNKDVQSAQSVKHPVGFAAYEQGQGAFAPTPAQIAQTKKDAENLGKLSGEATVLGLNSVHPSTYAFEGAFIQSLQRTRKAARPEAAQTMLEYAAELQNKGDLPKNAVKSMVKGIEEQFPALTTYLKHQGDNLNGQMADNMKLTKAQNTLETTLETMKKQWYLFGVDKNVNGSNLQANLQTAMKQMQAIIRTSTGAQKQEAVQAYKQLKNQASTEFQSMVTDSTNKMQQMSASVRVNGKAMASVASTELGNFQDSVWSAMQASTVSTSKGMAILLKDTNRALKEFGIKKLMTVPQLEILQGAKSGAVIQGHRVAGAARGAIYDIGARGTPGHDTVPLSVGGSNIMVAPGERVAVLNRHQQPIVDSALASRGYAGLDGLFGKVNTPNYMAKGGWVPGLAAGGTYSYGQLERLWDQAGGPPGLANVAAAIAEAESSGIASNRNPSGASGLWQILGQLVPGNILNPQINAENAVAKWRTAPGGGNNFSPWVTYESGAYRHFLNGRDSSTGGMAVPTIIAPIVTGGPTALNEAGTQSLKLAANAANQYLLTNLGSVTGGGAGTPGPTTTTPSSPSRTEMVMLRAAASIIGKPYTYGGGHNAEFAGTPGYDCSGAVSYVLHAANLLGSPITAGAGGSVGSWGVAGPGKFITVGSRGSSGQDAHMMMSLYGKFFESGGQQDNVHWDSGWDGAFSSYRHPQGYAKGGVFGDFGEVPPSYFLAHDDPITKTAMFREYAKKHPQGRAAGGWLPFVSGGIHHASTPRATKPKTIKGPKPRITKPVKIHSVKLPRFKALPNFDPALQNEIASLDNFVNTDLTNWQTLIEGQHNIFSVQPTLTDILGNEYINWGDPNAKYNYMHPTGGVDPSTNQATKSIFDRLKEIGATGSASINNAWPGGPVTDGQVVNFDYSDKKLSAYSQPLDELGIDRVMLMDWLQEFYLAKTGVRRFGSPEEAQNAVNTVKDVLKKPYQYSLNTASGSVLEYLESLRSNAKTWVTKEIYDLAYHQADEQNQIEINSHLHKQLQQNAPTHQREDAEITRYYSKARSKIAQKSLSQAERDALMLNDRETQLRKTETTQLGAIVSTPPSGWKGDRQTWNSAVAVQRANVMNDFNWREQNLRNLVTKEKYDQSLSNEKAREALTLEESWEKQSLTTIFDNQRIALDNAITASTAHKDQQAKYVTRDQGYLTIGTGTNTGLIQSSTAGTSSYWATLQSYLDPNGPLRSSDISQMQTIGIPTLQNEATALALTPVQAVTTVPGTGTSTTSQLQAEIAQQLAITVAAQAAALNVLGGLASLPMDLSKLPFGGSFAQGGVVPGYPGEPHVILAHGGERVTPQGGGSNVNIHVANGMGWLAQFVQAQITQSTRQSVRRASRRMPSAGGGFILGR